MFHNGGGVQPPVRNQKRKRRRMCWNGKVCILMKNFAKDIHIGTVIVIKMLIDIIYTEENTNLGINGRIFFLSKSYVLDHSESFDILL